MMVRPSFNSKLFFSIRSKLTIFTLLLILIPFATSGFVTYSRYNQTLETNTEGFASQIISQITINFNQQFDQLHKLSTLPYYDNELLQVLRNHDTPEKQQFVTNDEFEKMNLFISALMFERKDLKGIFIFSNDGTIFSNYDHPIDRSWRRGEQSWMVLAPADGQLVLIPPHDAVYYSNPTGPTISLLRPLIDPKYNTRIGFFKMDLHPDFFKNVLKSVNLGSNSRLFISNSNGAVIYPPGSSLSSFNSVNNHDVELDGKRYVHVNQWIESFGLNVTGLIAKADLEKDARELMRFTLLISIASFIIAAIAAALVAGRFIRPILQMLAAMKKVQKGHFDTRTRVSSNDELGLLADGFNKMVSEIDKLVKENYETKLREREAELSALHSQINPHFLFNTLELVSMMAVNQRYLEVVDILADMGKLIRYTVDKQEKPVPLSEELKFAEAYFGIQRIRMQELLKVEMEVDASLLTLHVPKLILQPLIENAVEHGIKETQGLIRVIVERHDPFIRIRVFNTGRRLCDKDKCLILQRLQEGARHADERFGVVKRGYALRNVHQRLRLLYGDMYGLIILEPEEEGTEFCLLLPEPSMKG